MGTMEKLEEVWRDIQGYEGRYQVSTHGRVRSLDRNVCTIVRGRPMCHAIPEHILQPMEWYDYFYVFLRLDGARRKAKVHRLVAQAFLDNPASLPVVNHKDRDRSNNRLENLEWATHKDNTLHWQKDKADGHSAPVRIADLPW